MNQSARRAQKITLGAAVFNKQGMILVDADGLVPSTIITDSFIPTVSGLQIQDDNMTISDKNAE